MSETSLAAQYPTILVTGASGRLGSNLCKRLLAEGVHVRAFLLEQDPAERTLEGLSVEKFYGDLRQERAVGPAVAGAEAVVHCGAVMGGPRGGLSAHGFFDINVRGSFNVFWAAAQSTDSVKKVVYLSSTTAYDVWTAGPVIREDHPLRPRKLYGTTKAAAESIAHTVEFQSGIPFVILRPNYLMACDEILGFGRAGAVINALKAGATDPRCTMYREGVAEPWKLVEAATDSPSQRVVPRDAEGNPWTWHVTDVRDGVEAVVLSLLRPEANGCTFNIAGPEPARWDCLVPYLCDRLGETFAEVTLPNLWHFEFDLSLAKERLGFTPAYPVEHMVDDALRFQAGEDLGVIPPAIPH